MAVDDAEGSPGQAESESDEPPARHSSPSEDPAAAVDYAVDRGIRLHNFFEAFCNPATTPVVKGTWRWEHHKRLYYYEPDGSRPRTADGDLIPFDKGEALGFAPDAFESMLAAGADTAEQLAGLVDERTVDVQDDIDEDAFFTTD